MILTHPEDGPLLAKRREDYDAAIAAQIANAPDPFKGR
jgi:hypothetical protein